jgi:hypothetical protein
VIASAPGATAHDIIASELHTNCLVDAINEAWREKVRRALMHISNRSFLGGLFVSALTLRTAEFNSLDQIIHDAVRPVSVIQHLFASEIVNATVRGEGVREIPGREWQSYLRTMPVSRNPIRTCPNLTLSNRCPPTR